MGKVETGRAGRQMHGGGGTREEMCWRERAGDQ